MITKNQDLQVVAEGHIKAIEDQILKLQESGELDLPQDYSASNALRSAYLILQETTDMSNKPALEVCSKPSIANALMDMVTQGLNPAKNQGYFIVYAGKLTFQRSYFGSEALAKRIDLSIADIVAEPIYAGDTVEYSIVHGKKVIAKHLQTLDSVDAGKVKAAYAMTIDHAGEITRTIMMTYEEIKAAWRQGKSKPFDDSGELKKSSVHAKFTGEMARRTVINRLCKDIINSSSDKNLLKKAIDQADQENAEVAVEAEIDAKANKEFIDITSGEVVDTESTDTTKTPQPSAEKTEPEKTTDAPAEGKETPEPQENSSPEKEFGTESPVDTALRTAKEEKEQKQAEPKARPKFVEGLNKWLDDVKPEMRFACMEKIKEDSFPKLCEEDRDKVIVHYNELPGAEHQGPDF